MYQRQVYVQDPARGSIDRILTGIVESVRAIDFTEFNVSVAYATRAGVRSLVTRLAAECPSWQSCSKRWLISIDFGHTEPEALEFLLELPSSAVRIPNGSSVVVRSGFSPSAAFHTKLYAAGSTEAESTGPLALFIGSGNLSRSGLTAGWEAGIGEAWAPPLSDAEEVSLMSTRAELQWFDGMWESATLATEILEEYRVKRVPSRNWGPVEEQTESVVVSDESEPPVIEPSQAVLLANGKALWIEPLISPNLGPGVPGNQLDLFRGARVFFGFSSHDVPRNTVLGEVQEQCRGFPMVSKNMRYGNNMMDKLNLPIPGSEGPESYDQSVLLFERRYSDEGLMYFEIRLGDETALDEWTEEFEYSTAFQLQSGRRWGVLY